MSKYFLISCDKSTNTYSGRIQYIIRVRSWEILFNTYSNLGPEKKSKIPDEEANTITAYHEGGHAIVAYFTKYSHPLHKVTIMPRGSSLGHV